jgi:hypothetical protein
MTQTEALRLALDAFGEIAWSNQTQWQSDRAKVAITAIKAALEAKDEPVQVSPLQFVEMVMEKEHLVGKPIFWAEWPNKEKNT